MAKHFAEDFKLMLDLHQRVPVEVLRTSDQVKAAVKVIVDTVSKINEAHPSKLLQSGFVITGSHIAKNTDFVIEQTELKLALSEIVSSSCYRVKIDLMNTKNDRPSSADHHILSEAILLALDIYAASPSGVRVNDKPKPRLCLANHLQESFKMYSCEAFVNINPYAIDILFPIVSL